MVEQENPHVDTPIEEYGAADDFVSGYEDSFRGSDRSSVSQSEKISARGLFSSTDSLSDTTDSDLSSDESEALEKRQGRQRGLNKSD